MMVMGNWRTGVPTFWFKGQVQVLAALLKLAGQDRELFITNVARLIALQLHPLLHLRIEI